MDDMKPVARLPKWDLISIYPGLDSHEFGTDVERLSAEVIKLRQLVIHDSLNPLELARILMCYNAALDLAEIVEGYAVCCLLVNSADESARGWATRTRQARTELQLVERRLATLSASLDDERSTVWPEALREHAFWKEQARIVNAHALSTAEEDLAIKLNETGGSAW